MKRMFFSPALLVFLLCLFGCKQGEPYTPTVLMVSDSIGLGEVPVVQKDLAHQFHVNHACGNGKYGHCNNGQTHTILANMHNYFVQGDADVVTFNTGIHDMSKSLRALSAPCTTAAEMTPPGQYFENLSRIADYLKAHARVVIWVDTTSLPASLCASTHLKQYNDLAEKVARDHGFYILRLSPAEHDKEGIHFTYAGYIALGHQVSACIITAWTGQATEDCNTTGG